MTIQMIVIFLGAAVTLVLLATVIFGKSPSQKRCERRVAQISQRAGGAVQINIDADISLRREEDKGRFHSLEKLVQGYLPSVSNIKAKLHQTGKDIPFGTYLMACLIVGAVAFALGAVILQLSPVLALLKALIAGIGLPYFAINHMANSRMQKFIEIFPDAIDLIVRGLKSGLPVSESIGAVGREMTGPVGEEFRTVFDEMAFGKTLDQALWDATKRLSTPEFKFFVISLSVQQETGGNLAETLANLSDILRRRRQMKLKIKAMSSEAKASAIILGSLPFLMFGIISLINFEYLLPLFTDPAGNRLLVIGFTSLTMGVVTMMRLVRFEI